MLAYESTPTMCMKLARDLIDSFAGGTTMRQIQRPEKGRLSLPVGSRVDVGLLEKLLGALTGGGLTGGPTRRHRMLFKLSSPNLSKGKSIASGPARLLASKGRNPVSVGQLSRVIWQTR